MNKKTQSNVGYSKKSVELLLPDLKLT